jgi:hypothetical protein
MTEPFEIERLGDRRVVVRFSSWVSSPCTQQQSDKLTAVLAEADTLAFELTGTELLGSDWWRCIGRLAKKAGRTGQRVVAVGVDEVLRTTADAVLVSKDVTFVSTLADAWA